jgi:hypothetical protein
LAELALKNQTTVESIIALNGVNTAHPGERLIIAPCEGVPYVVRPFDNCEKIARVYRTSVNRVIAAASGAPLYLGRILYLG